MSVRRIVEQPFPLFAAIFAVFLVAYGASVVLGPQRYGRLITGDGIYYYVYLRSAWLDHDLDFTNDYTLYQDYIGDNAIKRQEMLELHKTPLGLPANYFSVGPAVLWSPVFAVTRGILSAARGLGAQLRLDGFSYFEEMPLMIASMVYGFIGLWLVYRLCVGLFSREAALLAVLGTWLATNVVYYMGISPSASHVLSLFAVSVFVLLGWRWRGARTNWRWFLWGASAGLMALVRWQDGLIALFALFEWLGEWRTPTTPEKTGTAGALLTPGEQNRDFTTGRTASHLIHGMLFVLGTVLAFMPQWIAWQTLYGTWLTLPQGEGFLGYFNPQMLQVWFSTKRGLFSWTPILLLAVLGFGPLVRRDRSLGAAAIAAFLLESYITSIVPDWWGGEAFGARRFVALVPFFALGLAALYDWAVRRVGAQHVWRGAVGLFLALVVWNNLFILQYTLWLKGFGQISPMPTLAEITIDKFLVPLRWLAARGR